MASYTQKNNLFERRLQINSYLCTVKIFNLTIMDIQKVNHYKAIFDSIAHTIKDDDGNSMEVWYARELQHVLGYARWENFVVALGRAMQSCKSLKINVDDHFREVTKMILRSTRH